jgi:hypothetical protein
MSSRNKLTITVVSNEAPNTKREEVAAVSPTVPSVVLYLAPDNVFAVAILLYILRCLSLYALYVHCGLNCNFFSLSLFAINNRRIMGFLSLYFPLFR